MIDTLLSVIIFTWLCTSFGIALILNELSKIRKAVDKAVTIRDQATN
jgi:hypothetical protein